MKTFYHGTSNDQAANILANGVNLDYPRVQDPGDFGWGFYITQNLDSAKSYSRGGAILKVTVDETKLAFIQDPYFTPTKSSGGKRTKPETDAEKLFFDIAYTGEDILEYDSSGRIRSIQLARMSTVAGPPSEIVKAAKKVREAFLASGYSGIETLHRGSEAVLFGLDCLLTIDLLG